MHKSLTGNTINTQRMATAALVGIGYYVVAVLALHILQPEISPVREVTAAHALGKYGLLMNSAFLVFGLGQLALVLGLYLDGSGPAQARFGLALLGVWAVGNLVAAIFPIPVPEPPQTPADTVAQINGPVHVVSLIVGAFLVSLRLGAADRWEAIGRPVLGLSLVMVVEFGVVFAALATGADYLGLAQRVFVVTTLTWLTIVAARLRSMAR